jgi:hypothetical protein
MASCYHTVPEPSFNISLVLPADSMVSLLTDIHVVDGIISALKEKKKPVSHLSEEYFDLVLKKHSMNRETFEESMRYYAYHTEELNRIYEQVIINLSKQESMTHPDKGTKKLEE